MKFRRKSALIAPAVILAMTAAACGGSDTDGGGGGGGGTAQGGRLTYGLDTKTPSNLFPVISAGNSVATAYVEIRVLPSPFRIYPDFTVKPDSEFVEGEPTSTEVGGKQTVTYKINPNAIWSDGTQVTDKDFEFTWRIQKSADPAKGGCAELIGTTGYDQIESVKGADNGKTVTVTYAKPYADWKSIFQLFPQHLMDKGNPAANCAAIKKGWPTAEGVPASAGPWKLEKSGIDVARNVMTLTRNDKYWGEKPKLDALVVQSIGSDAGTVVKALRNDEVQMIYPQPQLDLVKNIKALEPKVTSKTSFGLSFEHIDMNTKDPQLAQKEVRQAIAWAINRPDLVSKTVGQFDNRAQVLNSRFYVNNQTEYKDNTGGAYAKQDIAKAKSLLEGIGYKLGADGIYAKGGQRLSFELMTTQLNPLRESTVDVVSAQLKPAGIEIKKFLNADIFEGPEKPKSLAAGGFQLALFAWVSSPFVSANAPIYQSPVGDNFGQNYSKGSNKAVDALLPQIAAEPDSTKAAALANQADALLWQDMFTYPLYQKPVFIAFSSNFTGIEENASNAGPLWAGDKFARKA